MANPKPYQYKGIRFDRSKINVKYMQALDICHLRNSIIQAYTYM